MFPKLYLTKKKVFFFVLDFTCKIVSQFVKETIILKVDILVIGCAKLGSFSSITDTNIWCSLLECWKKTIWTRDFQNKISFVAVKIELRRLKMMKEGTFVETYGSWVKQIKLLRNRGTLFKHINPLQIVKIKLFNQQENRYIFDVTHTKFCHHLLL